MGASPAYGVLDEPQGAPLSQPPSEATHEFTSRVTEMSNCRKLRVNKVPERLFASFLLLSAQLQAI
jgi:hypothetical protein